MYRISRYILMVLLLAGLAAVLQAQSKAEKDSLRFHPLRDSAVALSRTGDLDKAEALAEEILQSATKAASYRYIVEGHLLKLRLNGSKGLGPQNVYKDAVAVYELGMQHKYYEPVVISANLIALVYFNKSEYDSAKAYYKRAMDTARDYFPRRYPLAISNMAFINGVIDNRSEELEYHLLALKVSEEHPEYDRAVGVRANAYSGIGDYYRFIENFEKAVENYEAKLKLSEEHDLIRSKYEAMYGLAKTYEHKGFYDFEKSEKYYLIVAQDTTPTYGAYRYRSAMGLAQLYITEKKYKESQVLLLEARAYFKSKGSRDYVSNAEELLAFGYYELKNFQEARRWAVQAIESTRKNGLISRERKALSTLYRIDSIEGRYKDAFLNFQRFRQIDDSLNNVESTNRLNELQIEYETEETTRQNESLKTSLEIEGLRSQRKNTVIASVGAVSLLLVVSMVIVYRNYNRKKRDHDTIASQAAELRQLSDFKEGLTGMVVHDMKNPINSIIGFSRGTPDEKKMKKINQSGYNILNLVTNMLDIQRFEETKVDVIKGPLEAHRLVADAGNEVHLLLQAKSLRFKNQIPKGVVLNAEKALLDRVMVNLLTNAIKYSESGSEVYVLLGELKDGFREIIVKDQGEGITREKLPYVFNKFWHKDARKSGLAPSTGLGLSFCKLAVEAHGGTIRVESELRAGTSMIFTAPLAGEGIADFANTNQNTVVGHKEVFNTEKSEVLKAYLPQLKTLKVYQVSAINRVINELEEKGVNPNWLLALQGAVYQGDQAHYDELISGNPIEKTI